jgi:hypothetical protein
MEQPTKCVANRASTIARKGLLMSNAFVLSSPVMLANDGLGRLVVCDGMCYYLTECCGASGKGSGEGIVCRSCYRPVGDQYGMGWLVSDSDAWARYALQMVGEYVGENAAVMMRAAMRIMMRAQAASV